MAKGKDVLQQAAALMGGTGNDRVGRTTAPLRQGSGRYKATNHKEDEMLDALDMKRHLERLVPILEKLDKGHYDMGQALDGISGMALRELVGIAFGGGSEKNKLDAVKHILGLGGHVPVQKHAVGSFDASQPKAALMSIINGAKADLADEGIEIIDDEDQA